MRKMDPRAMDELRTLTKLKEMAAAEDVGRLSLALSTLEQQIAELCSQPTVSHRLEDMRSLDRWLLWRQQELGRISVQQAALKAEFLKVQMAFGRAKAEHEVAKKLSKMARTAQLQLIRQRKLHIS